MLFTDSEYEVVIFMGSWMIFNRKKKPTKYVLVAFMDIGIDVLQSLLFLALLVLEKSPLILNPTLRW